MKSLSKKSVVRQGKVEPVLFDVLYVKNGLSTLLREQLPVHEAVAELREIAAHHMCNEMPTPFMIPSDLPLCFDIKPEYDEDWRQVDIDREYEDRSEFVRLEKEAAREMVKKALAPQAPKLVS